MAGDEIEWRWADLDGVQNIVDEWELSAQLGDETLPDFTLVWRTGWTDWLHAYEVAELVSALPLGKAQKSVEPETDDSMDEPPEPNLTKYESFLSRDDAKKLASPKPKEVDTASEKRASVPPPPPSADAEREKKEGAAAAARLIGAAGSMAAPPRATPSVPPSPVGTPPRPVASRPPPPPPPPGTATAGGFAPPPPPSLQRPPMPTLAEPGPTTGGTLRPPGAVPPPPRAIPGPPGTPSDLEAKESTPASVPPPPGAKPLGSVPPPPPSRSGAPPPPPGSRKPSIPPPPDFDKIPDPPTNPIGAAPPGPLPAFEDDPGRASAPTIPPSMAYQARAPFPTVLVVLGGAIGLLLLAVIVVLATRSGGAPKTVTVRPDQNKALGAPATGVGATPRPRTRPVGCTSSKKPRKLAPRAYIRVAPELLPNPGSERVALGFAASGSTAVGITLDPESLDADRPFEAAGRDIVSVAPAIEGGKLSFAVDRGSGELQNAKPILGTSMTAGLTSNGFATVSGDSPPKVVWNIGAKKITAPRMAHVSGVGHAVTFRRDGQSGKVVAGWLDSSGSKKTDLIAVDTVPFVGTPTIAAGDEDVLITFAARANKDAYWGVVMAKAKHGANPTKTKRFPIPSGGPGSQAISPSAAGLPGGKWLVQWTEGTGGQHSVRVQTLDSNLVALGDPVNVSPPDANAGQGVVWATGKRAVSLYFAKTAEGHELWGAAIECP